jgi:D-glycero-D-manno-heptose 1,7-bisphosphate phosphatase
LVPAMTAEAGKRVVFVDRDGTINVDKHFVHRVEQVELIEGVVDGLRILEGQGFLLAIVSNQSGVAYGRFPESDVQKVNTYLRDVLAERGVHIRTIVYCPHHIEGSVPKYAIECECQKPKTGLAKQVEAAIGPIDYAQSWTIGDKPTDHGFGVALGTKTVLLRSEYWSAPPSPPPTIVASALLEAAQKIKAGSL